MTSTLSALLELRFTFLPHGIEKNFPAEIDGTPAPGFRIAAVEAVPLVVSVEGDGDQLAELDRALRPRQPQRGHEWFARADDADAALAA